MIVTGGLAVGVAIFIMVMTNTEHAPAAGIALGLTLNEWNIKTLLFIAAAVIFIMLIRRLLKPFMINLIGEELSRPRSGMRLTSPAFREGDMIPEKYASDGEDISPPLNIEKVPPGTSSLVLSMTDYRGFMGCCQHWVVWNIPPETIEIKEGENPPGIQGLNDFDRLEYIGPLSLPGTHSYMFKLYALDSKLNLPEGSSILKVERAMCGKIIEKTVLEVKYRGRC